MGERPHLETLEKLARHVPPEDRRNARKFTPMQIVSTTTSILHKIGHVLSADERALIEGTQAQALLDAGVGGDEEKALVNKAEDVRRRKKEAAKNPQPEPKTPPSILRRLR